MKTPKPDINSFKNSRVYKAFMDEAMALETNLSRRIDHDHSEILHLYVNDNTGHIITWYRENDPAAMFLDAVNEDIYHKILWQVQGSA